MNQLSLLYSYYLLYFSTRTFKYVNNSLFTVIVESIQYKKMANLE